MASTYQQLINEWNKGQAEAKAANLGRFEEVKGGYQDLINRTRSRVQSLGGQQRTDIINRGTANQAAAQQDLISRGLTGTTIAPTVAQGFQRDTQASLNRLQDQLTRQELATVNPLEQESLRFIERREDIGPDSAMLSNLLTRAGRAGGTRSTTTSRRLLGSSGSGSSASARASIGSSPSASKITGTTFAGPDNIDRIVGARSGVKSRYDARRQAYLDSLKKRPATSGKNTVMRNFTMEQVAPGTGYIVDKAGKRQWVGR